MTDELPLRGEIYDKLKFCAANNIPRKITNILEVLKLEAQVPDFPPEQDRIHVFNGTLLLNGTFTEGRSAIVRSRLPVVYNPDAPVPVIWLNFLDGLLHAEDIPTLQEFIGYCLIPSNKGQRMMVIKGNSGEGKSQIGAVLSAIIGTNMKDSSIGKISENRFARADLEHILLCVDDDMRMEALRHTNYVKSIVTAQGNRGTCTAHYIREETLRDLVLERIRAVCDYIRSDVDGFQEEWLQCRRTDQEKSILEDQRKIAKAKKRLADLDVLITRIYEDAVLGNLSQERYQKMSQSYEEEQERLKLEIEVTEEWVDQQMELEGNLDAFLALTEKYVDIPELTPTIVNEFIKKILVYAPDKSSGKRQQRVRIFFNFLDEVEIPAVFEPIIYERPTKNRKTA